MSLKLTILFTVLTSMIFATGCDKGNKYAFSVGPDTYSTPPNFEDDTPIVDPTPTPGVDNPGDTPTPTPVIPPTATPPGDDDNPNNTPTPTPVVNTPTPTPVIPPTATPPGDDDNPNNTPTPTPVITPTSTPGGNTPTPTPVIPPTATPPGDDDPGVTPTPTPGTSGIPVNNHRKCMPHMINGQALYSAADVEWPHHPARPDSHRSLNPKCMIVALDMQAKQVTQANTILDIVVGAPDVFSTSGHPRFPELEKSKFYLYLDAAQLAKLEVLKNQCRADASVKLKLFCYEDRSPSVQEIPDIDDIFAAPPGLHLPRQSVPKNGGRVVPASEEPELDFNISMNFFISRGNKDNSPSGPHDGSDCEGLAGIEKQICETNCDTVTDPLVLDFLNDGVHLTDNLNGVNFDINGVGGVEKMSFLDSSASTDGILFIDNSASGHKAGRPDDGTELFSNITKLPGLPNQDFEDGFSALSNLLAPGKTELLSTDANFKKIYLWLSNGSVIKLSDPLPGSGKKVQKILLDSSDIDSKFYLKDQFGNETIGRTQVILEDGSVIYLYEILFSNQ